MAIVTFDTASYPLETSTEFDFFLGNEIDFMRGGAIKSRIVTREKPIAIKCSFIAFNETKSELFQKYLYSLLHDEVDIVHAGNKIRGSINGRSVSKKFQGGVHHLWSFEFAGVIVS